MGTIPQAFENFYMPEPNSGCWLWIGSVNTQGYGNFRGHRSAHRVSYEMHKGPIPEGLVVCHRCDMPSCVNPDHLFVGTQAENMRDAGRKGRLRRSPETNGRAKLSYSAADFIRTNYRWGHPEFGGKALAERFHVSPSAISVVVRRKSWAAMK